MKDNVVRGLLCIPIITAFILSAIFGYADTHKSEWKEFTEYVEELVK